TLTPDNQQDIYLKNINGSHQSSLAKIYPACFNILGQDYFNQVCRHYRKKHPSRHPDFNQYGRQFSVYLQDLVNSNNELESLFYIAELAHHEWHWHQSFFFNNTDPFNHDAFKLLSSQEYERLIFDLSPSIYFNKSELPIIEIWNANRYIADAEQEFSMPDETVYYCIHRTQLLPELIQISKKDYDLFLALKKNKDFNSIAASFQHSCCPIPEFIKNNWVTGFHLKAQA
ncbi:MAG: putative DNA-binding domain-containing protein, partial [Gammaproteobacteria bacterium]|nr:putative DNA-binding domain-containing protein [Gammaproteobacteria bacterium]